MIPLLSVLMGVMCAEATGAQAPEPVPMTAVASPSAESPAMYQVQLTNNGPRTAVAWSLRSAFTFPDGRKEVLNTHQDLYPLVVRPAKAPVMPLTPGQSLIVTTIGFGTEVPLAVEVTVTAVVYDNRTSMGDPAMIDAAFARRANDARKWKAMVASLRDTASGVGLRRVEMERVLDDLESAPTSDERSVEHAFLANNLRNLLRKHPRDSAAMSAAAKELQAMLDAYAQGAAEQSVRP